MDVRPYLEYPVFERLLDPGFFALAQADHGFRTLSAPLHSGLGKQIHPGLVRPPPATRRACEHNIGLAADTVAHHTWRCALCLEMQS
jgi:hypothetical protein